MGQRRDQTPIQGFARDALHSLSSVVMPGPGPSRQGLIGWPSASTRKVQALRALASMQDCLAQFVPEHARLIADAFIRGIKSLINCEAHTVL